MSNSVQPHGRQPTRLPRPWDSPGKNTGVGCHFLLQCMKVKSESEVFQSCLTLCDPMDCSPPGSSIHGIFQARVLEWGAIAFSIIAIRPLIILFKSCSSLLCLSWFFCLLILSVVQRNLLWFVYFSLQISTWYNFVFLKNFKKYVLYYKSTEGDSSLCLRKCFALVF